MVASLVGNINGTSVQPPIRHRAGKTNPNEPEVRPLNGTTIRSASAKSSST